MNKIALLLKDNNGPNLAIVYACSIIVKINIQKFKLCKNNNDRQQLLKELWSDTHGSTLTDDEILFKNYNDMLMFVLKFQL